MKRIEITDEQYREFQFLGIPFEDVEEEKEEKEEKSKFNDPWYPESEFYYIDRDFSIQKSSIHDNRLFNTSKDWSTYNCFQTDKQAERRAKEFKVYNLLKNFSDANGGDKIDWNDPSQAKYRIRYEYDDLSLSFYYQTKDIMAVYFISYEVAEEAWRRYKDQLEELRK